MTLSKRIRRLEGQDKEKADLMMFIRIGDDMRSAHVGGVGHMERNLDETEEDFVRHAYATKAAGRPLDELTESERCDAFHRGDIEHVASTSRTVTIGGENHEAF